MKLRHINKDRTDKGESSYWQLWKTLLPNINWDTHFFSDLLFFHVNLWNGAIWLAISSGNICTTITNGLAHRIFNLLLRCVPFVIMLTTVIKLWTALLGVLDQIMKSIVGIMLLISFLCLIWSWFYLNLGYIIFPNRLLCYLLWLNIVSFPF